MGILEPRASRGRLFRSYGSCWNGISSSSIDETNTTNIVNIVNITNITNPTFILLLQLFTARFKLGGCVACHIDVTLS